mmetsp:Transcript_66543/g.158712  ORF Transcript_66543/g.158712 Transcript_66543/m.158712 type:complete len:247 (+) Transcript_66543:212-952(+)
MAARRRVPASHLRRKNPRRHLLHPLSRTKQGRTRHHSGVPPPAASIPGRMESAAEQEQASAVAGTCTWCVCCEASARGGRLSCRSLRGSWSRSPTSDSAGGSSGTCWKPRRRLGSSVRCARRGGGSRQRTQPHTRPSAGLRVPPACKMSGPTRIRQCCSSSASGGQWTGSGSCSPTPCASIEGTGTGASSPSRENRLSIRGCWTCANPSPQPCQRTRQRWTRRVRMPTRAATPNPSPASSRRCVCV